MNHPRVNLLKKSEQRYQGAVSHRFILVAAVVAPILFVAVLSGVKLIQYAAVKSDLQSNRAVWETLEPRLQLHQEELCSLNACRSSMVLLDGWKDSQVSLSDLLSEIQGAVPPAIQLQRLSVRSEPKTSVYRQASDIALDYKLMLQGLSQGERAEDAVIGLRRDLMATDLLGTTFKSVRLASMHKLAGKGDQNTRDFRIEGFSKEGESQ